MWSTVLPMVTKMSASRTRNAAATSGRPTWNAPLRMANSLKKGENGGDPVMARKPSRKSGPEMGSRRAAPRTCSTCFEPKARWMFPAVKKSTPLVSPLLTMWKKAPAAAAPPRPTPTARMPMCSTLEYASSRLKSR